MKEVLLTKQNQQRCDFLPRMFSSTNQGAKISPASINDIESPSSLYGKNCNVLMIMSAKWIILPAHAQ